MSDKEFLIKLFSLCMLIPSIPYYLFVYYCYLSRNVYLEIFGKKCNKCKLNFKNRYSDKCWKCLIKENTPQIVK